MYELHCRSLFVQIRLSDYSREIRAAELLQVCAVQRSTMMIPNHNTMESEPTIFGSSWHHRASSHPPRLDKPSHENTTFKHARTSITTLKRNDSAL